MTTPDQTADRTQDVAEDVRQAAWNAAGHIYDPENPCHAYATDVIAQAIAAERARLAEEIETLRRENDSWRDAFSGMHKQAMAADAALATAQAENARLREALKPFGDIAGEAWADENGWTEHACPRDRICDWFGPSAFLAARRAALSADKPAGGGEPVADAREIEWNVKSKIRLAFRKALATLPEIAPAEIASVLSSVHMQDEFFVEGKRLQMEYGTDAVAPRVEQECGAGAWSFMRKGVLAALQPAPAPDWEKAVEAAWDAYQNCPIDMCNDSDEEQKKCVMAALRAAAPHLREG